MDLQIAGASLFGILLSKYEPVICLKLAAGLMISSLPVVVLVYCFLDLRSFSFFCKIILTLKFIIFLGLSHVVNQQAFCWCS